MLVKADLNMGGDTVTTAESAPLMMRAQCPASLLQAMQVTHTFVQGLCWDLLGEGVPGIYELSQAQSGFISLRFKPSSIHFTYHWGVM